MPLHPQIIKQMREGTLTEMNLAGMIGHQMTPRDIKMLSDYIRTSETLRSISFQGSHYMFDQLADALKQNTSLSRLDLTQQVHDQNVKALTDILAANKGISDISLDYCNLQHLSVVRIAMALKGRENITSLNLLNVGYDHATGQQGLDRIINVVKGSKNILSVSPDPNDALKAVLEANNAAATALLEKINAGARGMPKDELQDAVDRLPAILHLSENAGTLKTDIAKNLVVLEDAAQRAGIAFDMPIRYRALAETLPRPFHPSADKVDFMWVKSTEDLRKQTIYKAAEAGQVDDLLAAFNKHGRKITAADCAYKPEDKAESTIELVARQGRLADFMTAAMWSGDPRGFKETADKVPAREWQRQMKENAETVLSRVNAESFKKNRRQRQPGA